MNKIRPVYQPFAMPVDKMVINKNPEDYFTEVEQVAFGTGVLVDGHENPHINYEPSLLGGLKEAKQSGKEHTPFVEGNIVRQPIDRTNDTKQAGETYRKFEKWEQDDLILNLTTDLAKCAPVIQETMIRYAEEADEEYGRRLRENLKNSNESGPLGNPDNDKAVQEAIDNSRETGPL
ncbi:catalase [Solibacillus kalamii]|nr:catalase [Solibacillus kalamii]